jgi:hypothetical protein
MWPSCFDVRWGVLGDKEKGKEMTRMKYVPALRWFIVETFAVFTRLNRENDCAALKIMICDPQKRDIEVVYCSGLGFHCT